MWNMCAQKEFKDSELFTVDVNLKKYMTCVHHQAWPDLKNHNYTITLQMLPIRITEFKEIITLYTTIYNYNFNCDI